MSPVRTSTTFSPGRGDVETPLVPRKLAAHYPADARDAAERTFRQVLTDYHKIEAQFGIPRNDVAGATAAIIAGGYIAYRDVDLPDENFKALVAQMRQIIGGNASFLNASTARKQEMYEQMAIAGTYLALARQELKSQPNAQTQARLKEAAKNSLEQFLNIDADRVEITGRGLVLK
jgi:hypothetical protein